MDKILVINDDAKINVEITGFFYKRIQSTLLYLLDTIPDEKQKIEVLSKIQNGTIETRIEHEVQTLLALSKHIEESAEKQKQTSKMDKSEFEEKLEEAVKKSEKAKEKKEK